MPQGIGGDAGMGGKAGFGGGAVGGGGSAPVFVNAQNCSSSGANCTITTAPTAGHTNFVCVDGSGGGGNTVIVSGNVNTYSVAAGPNNVGAGVANLECFISVGISGTAETITCSESNSGEQPGCVKFELSGSGISVDQQANGSSASAVATWTTSATSTTTQASELLINVGATNNVTTTVTQGSGWTIPTGGSNNSNTQTIAMQYQTVSSTGAYSGTMGVSPSEAYGAIIITLK